MARIENLFVITSIVLLVGGISTPYLPMSTGWSIILGKTSFALGWETPLYGVAAFFGAFACLYSIHYLPFNARFIQWHFWLSLGCVIWCITGWVVFYMVARKEPETQLGIAGQVLATSFMATIPIFVATQLMFAFALVRALIKMRLT